MNNYSFSVVGGGNVSFSHSYDLRAGDKFRNSGQDYLVVDVSLAPNSNQVNGTCVAI